MRLAPLRDDELRAVADAFPSKPHAERLALQHAGRGVYVVAWDAAEPVAHGLLKFDAGTMPPEIEDLLVAEHRRERGIGTELLRDLERRAREAGFDRVSLGVEDVNVRARRLYEREGYVDAGLPPSFVEYRDDAGAVVHREPAGKLVKKFT